MINLGLMICDSTYGQTESDRKKDRDLMIKKKRDKERDRNNERKRKRIYLHKVSDSIFIKE